jgi:hypothetical protein
LTKKNTSHTCTFRKGVVFYCFILAFLFPLLFELYGCVDDTDCFVWLCGLYTNRGQGRGRGRGRGARGGRGAGGSDEEVAPKGPQPNVDMAAILVEM